MVSRRIFMVLFFLLIVLSLVPLAQAQDEMTCPQLVETVMTQIANNCAGAAQGESCYGFPNVEAAFMEGAAGVSLAQPGARADNLMLESVAGSPFNLDDETWGVSVNNVQANLPVALPGPGGVFITLGDVRLENGVPDGEAVILPETASEITIGESGADVYSAPPGYLLESAVVGNVPAGTVLEADAVSADGTWLRVYFVYETTYGSRADSWVSLDAAAPDTDVSGLATIGPDSFTPMQKLYLTNAFDDQPCDEATPSILYVQGPDEIETDFMVNDAEIRLTSTAMIRVLPNNLMQVLALSGFVLLNPRSANPVVLVPGYFSNICLVPENLNLGVDQAENDRQVGPDCTWSEPQQYPADALNRLYTALNERVPQSLLYYLLPAPRASCPSGVGGVICNIIVRRTYPRIVNLCRRGIIPASICDSVLP